MCDTENDPKVDDPVTPKISSGRTSSKAEVCTGQPLCTRKCVTPPFPSLYVHLQNLSVLALLVLGEKLAGHLWALPLWGGHTTSKGRSPFLPAWGPSELHGVQAQVCVLKSRKSCSRDLCDSFSAKPSFPFASCLLMNITDSLQNRH